jgi:hypothetical protein
MNNDKTLLTLQIKVLMLQHKAMKKAKNDLDDEVAEFERFLATP